MMDGSPGVGHIQEKSISSDLNSINWEAIRDNISPGRCDLFILKILKKLFSDFCSLLIELEGKEMTILANCLCDGAG